MKFTVKFRLVVSMLLLEFFFALPAFAMTPPVINYQGQLTDNTGVQVADDTYPITFSIYNSSGVQLWTETQSNVLVINGIFNVMLPADPGTYPFPAGLFNEELFLGVKVGTDPEMTPRQPLTSVPFALKAGDADTLQGLIPEDFADAGHEHDFADINGTVSDAQVPDTITIERAANADVAGFALNADQLDGRDSSSFADIAHGHDGGEIVSGVISESRIDPAIARDTEITWGNLSGIPSGFADGVDNDSGDITAVLAGVGLNGGGAAGDVSLHLDVPLNLGASLTAPIVSATNGGSGFGLYGESASGNGVKGRGFIAGVQGISTVTGNVYNWGGYFETTSAEYGVGVRGLTHSERGYGVEGLALSTANEINHGGHFEAFGTSGNGVWAKATGANGIGVVGEASGYSGHGVYGEAGGTNGYGVYGKAKDNYCYGLYGIHEANNNWARIGTPWEGVYAESSGGRGVYGKSTSNDGVRGNSVSGIGVVGESAESDGVRGTNTYLGNVGVLGHLSYGIWGQSPTAAVYGENTNGNLGYLGGLGAGVFGRAANSSYHAGYFDGKVQVDGTTTTEVLVITGGSDLCENFDVAPLDRKILPGMVVSIDPDRPGQLMLSRIAYDNKVAGIISGAGGIKTGMMMGQQGTRADGQHPVALTGRVYCWADASSGPIRPGDLLTTSTLPGHAMKVTDHIKANGAILGKAMTTLSDGKGLVLVLVSLQ